MKSMLEGLPDKTEYKNTTSLKFKRDLIEFFKDKDVESCLEVGTNHGHTTRVLSDIFKTVYTIDLDPKNTSRAKEVCEERTNINFITGDAYSDETYKDIPKVDVCFIDCMHTFEGVTADIDRAINQVGEGGLYLIFDDYGHPISIGVGKAVRRAIGKYHLTHETYVGEGVGFAYGVQGQLRRLINHEGIIVSYGK